MEDIHRNHKETAWGWVALVMALLDGFPRRRRSPPMPRRRPSIRAVLS